MRINIAGESGADERRDRHPIRNWRRCYHRSDWAAAAFMRESLVRFRSGRNTIDRCHVRSHRTPRDCRRVRWRAGCLANAGERSMSGERSVAWASLRGRF